jgi:ubiquinone/menaquinone biosynthesis C-methylase UbiE
MRPGGIPVQEGARVASPFGEFERSWRRRFSQFAARFDDDASIAGWSRGGLQARLRLFRRVWSGERPGSLWLDIGCGAGTYTRLLEERGLHVMALDYSVPSLQKAVLRSPATIRWAAADATSLPLRSGIAEGALCLGVLQAVSHPQPLVAELARVLAPGGRLHLDALNALCLPHAGEQLWRRLTGKPRHLRYQYPGALRATLAEAGLRVVAFHWLPLLPGRLGRFQLWLESAPARLLLRFVPGFGALLSHSFLIEAERLP